MKDNSLIGKIVYSKAGRDSKRMFIIVDVIDDDYVYIADGDLRKVEKPKKKKKRHLIITEKCNQEIRDLLLSGKKLNNLIFRKFLKSTDSNKEG